ncbi:hypothetical protein L0F63_004529 [Massospora cicadina]|nr:hypothetical protein L0F63_004529 [Massospora cicadina]
MGLNLKENLAYSCAESPIEASGPPNREASEIYLPSPNSCPPSPKPHTKLDTKLERSSSMQLATGTETSLQGDGTKDPSFDKATVPRVGSPLSPDENSDLSSYNLLSKSPTPEAIKDLSQELEIIERSLYNLDSEGKLANQAITARVEPRRDSSRPPSSHSILRISKEAAMARHLMRENKNLLKKLDRLEYQLHSRHPSVLEAPSTNTSLIEEDIPVTVAALKSKLSQCEEIIVQQRLQLEAQDARAVELERKLSSASDSLLVAQLAQTRNRAREATTSKGAGLARRAESDDPGIRKFVNGLFLKGSSNMIPTPSSRPLRSPVHITPSGEQLPLPIYSTGILKEPLSPIDMPSVSATSTPSHSRNSSFSGIARSKSASSLAQDPPQSSSKDPGKQPPGANKPPQSKKGKRAMEATIRDLEAALQDSYQQHSSLHTFIHNLQVRLESVDAQLVKQKEAHKQALDSLMDQIERSKLEAASYQRQLHDVTRHNVTLTAQLEEAHSRLAVLGRRKPRLFCL